MIFRTDTVNHSLNSAVDKLNHYHQHHRTNQQYPLNSGKRESKGNNNGGISVSNS